MTIFNYKKKENLVIFFLIIFSLILFIKAFIKNPDNYEAVFFLSSLLALIVSILCFIRKSSYFLLIAFLILFTSNFIYFFNNTLFKYIQNESSLFNLLYVLFLFIFSLNLEKKEYTEIFSKDSKKNFPSEYFKINKLTFKLLKCVIFFIFFYIFYFLDIKNEYAHISEIGNVHFLFFIFSNILESACMAIIFPLSLLSRNWYTIIIGNGLLIMSISEFVTKYAIMFEIKKNTNYEIFWHVGMAFVALSQLFFKKENQEKIECKWINFISIRSIPPLCILIISFPLSIFFLKLQNPTETNLFSQVTTNEYNFSNLIDPIDSIIFLVIFYVFLNLLSNFLSTKITKIPEMIRIPSINVDNGLYQNKDDVFLTLPENKMTLLEFKKFTIKYNQLINESNVIMNKLILEKQKSSIANITQMLAHDVRKPFSMLNLSLNLIENANDFDEIKNLTAVLIPEVNRALSSVNILILDILEIGNSRSPNKEPTNPIDLILESINEIFKIYYYAKIKFFYDFKHTYFVHVEAAKILRVISNIIENAVQSMKMSGNLYFSTSDFYEHNSRYIRFSIKNDGSYISKADIPKLFEPYFTKNKKGGTGLGLAIVKKIIHDNNGNIFCKSEKNEQYKNGFVEFIFTLPANINRIGAQFHSLPIESKEILNIYKINKSRNLKDEEILEKELIKILLNLNKKLNLLIVDDELIYCKGLADMILKQDSLKNRINIEIENTFDNAIENIFKNNYDLIIIDIDLGSEENGYELLKRARNNKINSYICIHSNRSTDEDYRKSYELGANEFTNKPMSRIDFLNLIMKSI